mgnify:CR=1 FL=1
MKNFTSTLKLFIVLFGLIMLHSCSEDDPIPEPPLTGQQMMFNLISVGNSGVMGNATFAMREDGATVLTLALTGTSSGNMHPSHIHFNTAAEGGDVAISLSPVDGATGESVTVITALEDGSSISYEELIDFDGYINVHNSMDDLATLLAQGDIGQNVLTGDSQAYSLGEKDVDGINGTFTLFERRNGEALAIVMLDGTMAGNMHPGHIHFNSAVEGGDIAYSFVPVNGETGRSVNNIAALDKGTAIGYDELLDFDGYVNIHNSIDDLATLVAQGDIGSNELTGEKISYALNEVDQAGTMGTITFMQRKDGSTLSKIELMNTVAGDMNPGHIHENSAAEGGDILFTFNPVNGDTGLSMTNIAMLDNGTMISYSDLLTIDGYVNIHKSMNDLGTLVGQGNIGANAN